MSSTFTPPSRISLMASADVEHHVYLLTYLPVHKASTVTTWTLSGKISVKVLDTLAAQLAGWPLNWLAGHSTGWPASPTDHYLNTFFPTSTKLMEFTSFHYQRSPCTDVFLPQPVRVIFPLSKNPSVYMYT